MTARKYLYIEFWRPTFRGKPTGEGKWMPSCLQLPLVAGEELERTVRPPGNKTEQYTYFRVPMDALEKVEK